MSDRYDAFSMAETNPLTGMVTYTYTFNNVAYRVGPVPPQSVLDMILALTEVARSLKLPLDAVRADILYDGPAPPPT